jgi:hypothetical protein
LTTKKKRYGRVKLEVDDDVEGFWSLTERKTLTIKKMVLCFLDELNIEVENGSLWLNTQRSSGRESLLGSSGISRLRTKSEEWQNFPQEFEDGESKNGSSGCYLTFTRRGIGTVFICSV